MKRTYTINISNRLFNIDEDAYEMFYDYLSTLRLCFARQDDGFETMADIESRIGEIILENNIAGADIIIDRPQVENIIGRIGRPEELGIEEPTSPEPEKIKKRLFRDPENKKVAGVCAGIAAYFGGDPVWIRIIAIILFLFLHVFTMLTYIALWVFLPVADTAADRLAMEGKSPTLDNIARSVARHHRPQPDDLSSSRSKFEKFCDFVTSFCAQAFKVLLCFSGLLALGAIVMLGLVAIGSIAAVCLIVSDSPLWLELLSRPDTPAMMLNSGFTAPVMLSVAGFSLAMMFILAAIIILVVNTIFKQPLLFNKITRITFVTAIIIGAVAFFLGICLTFVNNPGLIGNFSSEMLSAYN